MSDGVGETGRKEHEEAPQVKGKHGGEEFAHAIAKVAIGQICEGAGFQAFQQSALETLADIAVRFIRNIGKTANFYANLAGRADGNVFDIIEGLEELGFVQGYSGASDVDHCLASSGTIRELVHYVGEAEEIPFAYSISCFPVIKDREPRPSFLQIGQEPPEEHIPAWLPAFPDPQTYTQLLTENERATDSHTDKIEPASRPRKMERPLLNLQQQFSCNGLEGLSSLDQGGTGKGKQLAEVNPFFAAPLQFGEKSVSPVVLPPKLSDEGAAKNRISENLSVCNHVSVLDTFASAIEAMKSSLCDSEVGRKKVLLDQRPAVLFKIKNRKKPLASMPGLGSQNKGVVEIASLFGKENEEDDKKWRSRMILKDSMDNPPELPEL
ncbi:Bromo_TP domain-containing protein/TAF8_C domain-containing protein [Cephalotus follicularis]|uniref:Transcription initiation factor TFIID subunit 8 n=1 Tax=Cephalotus follicularis TaxID=3775 RepID=A0A1Q3CUJ6_CEPFO|nr:Bromo_TP domain-containing protein/TAF8_C domain-containing protein [Cephalotus follicularis]